MKEQNSIQLLKKTIFSAAEVQTPCLMIHKNNHSSHSTHSTSSFITPASVIYSCPHARLHEMGFMTLCSPLCFLPLTECVVPELK